MSIPVEAADIGDQMAAGFGDAAYLLSVGEDRRIHIAHLRMRLQDGEIRCGVSRTAARNVAANPSVSLLWPPFEAEGYSMIVDGVCSVADGDGTAELAISPTSGMLHRPARGPAQSTAPPSGTASQAESCGSDCAGL